MKDSKKAIMEATYKALCRHGYSDLTIQRIADEMDKAKSYVYHHYQDKDDLMLSFLDYLLEEMHMESSSSGEKTPEETLDKMLEDTLSLNDEMKEFRTAVMEMKAQTPHNEKFAEKFNELDDFLIKEFTQALEKNNVERPEIRAELLVSTIEGLMDRKIGYTTNGDIHELKNELKNQVLGEDR